MDILVFKTNLSNKLRIRDVEPILDIHPGIYQWNVDLHDHDKILRVLGNSIEGKEVEDILLSAGYYCEELE